MKARKRAAEKKSKEGKRIKGESEKKGKGRGKKGQTKAKK